MANRPHYVSADDKRCTLCGRTGHMAADCTWPRKSNVTLTPEKIQDIRKAAAEKEKLRQQQERNRRLLKAFRDEKKETAREIARVTELKRDYNRKFTLIINDLESNRGSLQGCIRDLLEEQGALNQAIKEFKPTYGDLAIKHNVGEHTVKNAALGYTFADLP